MQSLNRVAGALLNGLCEALNVTARRSTEAQVCALAENPQGWAGAFQMSDHMGSYGLIGVLLVGEIGWRYWVVLPRVARSDLAR